MAGKLCPNCKELTLHTTPKGAECSTCQLVVRTPANGGRGGRGIKCPMCKEHTVFKTGNKGSASCRSCGATFSGFGINE